LVVIVKPITAVLLISLQKKSTLVEEFNGERERGSDYWHRRGEEKKHGGGGIGIGIG
jgi:hypothetical protein